MTVAVLGLGAMGSRVARRLMATGYDVSVWNRTPGRAASLVREGARQASSPAMAAAGSDAIITMVADPDALTAIVNAPDGVAAGLRDGGLVIEMSTVGPSALRTIASLLPAEAELVDAPVLGSVAETEAGELTIFMGATEAGVERASPILTELGSVLHVGPPGSGAAAKIMANAALFGSVALLGETLVLGRRLGLGHEVSFDVLAATPLSGQAARRRPALEADSYPPRFRLALAAKDARIIRDDARANGADVRVVEAVARWFEDAFQAGDGDLDYSAVLRHILRQPPGDDS